MNNIVGLLLAVFPGIILLIKSRKFTVPFIVLVMAITGIIATLIYGWVPFVGAVLITIGLIAKRGRDRWHSDKAYFDYNGKIYSISMIKNKLSNKVGKNEIKLGEVQPTNHKQIKYNSRAIKLDSEVLSAGSLIAGAAGSGKTTLLESVLFQKMERGFPIAFLDYKGEEELIVRLEAKAKSLNIPFYEFSSRNCNFSYDPLIGLNETGKVEAILNTRKWSADGADEHYKTSAQLVTQNLVRAYDAYRENTEGEKDKTYTEGLYDYTFKYNVAPAEKDGFQSTVKMLEILLSSRAGNLLLGKQRRFSFNTDEQFIVVFSFVSSNKALAASLSSFIFQDLMDRGTNKRYNPKLFLGIDEFGTLVNSIVIKDIIEKGRSGGIQVLLSILDINQLAMNSGPYFVQAILGTLNNVILYAGCTKQTAEILGGVMRYEIDFDIMSLNKPYNGKPPTALVMSKFPLLDKKTRTQSVYKIIPNKPVKLPDAETGGVKNLEAKKPSDSNAPAPIEEPRQEYIEPIPEENIEDFF